MRLIVPYLLILLLGSAIVLSVGSRFYAVVAALQVFGWIIAIIGLRYKVPVLHRVAGPASALLMLNAAAVVGLYKFLFTHGSLSTIWNSSKPHSQETDVVAFDATQNTSHDSPRQEAMKRP
jgi:hypothetical protein